MLNGHQGREGIPWGENNTKIHCEVFQRLIRQYYTEKECKFPSIFVPPSHAFCKDDKESIRILHNYGIKYMCSSCANQPTMKHLMYGGDFDNGILMVDRTELCRPEIIGYAPKKILSVNSMIGTHFPNYWGETKRWISFFKHVRSKTEYAVGKNSEYTYSQWIYNHYTTLSESNGSVVINNLYAPVWGYDNCFLYGLVLKIHLHDKKHISWFESENLVLMDYYEDEFDNAYLTVGDCMTDNSALGKKIYSFKYDMHYSDLEIPHFIRDNQTYNILSLQYDSDSIVCRIRIFGEHNVKIYSGFNNANVTFYSEDIVVENIVTENKSVLFKINCREMLGKDVLFKINRLL